MDTKPVLGHSHTNDHSKLCLRRVSSRRTLVSTSRHSRLCVRKRSRRLRVRLQMLLKYASEGRQPTQNYFTGRLPAEIRLIIYECLLRFPVPIRLVRPITRTARVKTAGILLVSRLVYTEALAVLHELNTIVAPRSDLCRFHSGSSPRLSFKPELVQRLYLGDLHPSAECVIRMGRRWPAQNRPCENCRPSILGVIDTLRAMPRLENVFIDYHRHSRAVQALAEGLLHATGLERDLQITCTGIGKYRLSGAWLEGVEFELRNVTLTEIWHTVSYLPHPDPLISYSRASLAMWRRLKPLQSRFQDRRAFRLMVLQILVLFTEHDSGLIPANFAQIWTAPAASLRCKGRLTKIRGDPVL